MLVVLRLVGIVHIRSHVPFRVTESATKHTNLLGELFRFPVGEGLLCEILLGFPGRSISLTSAFVVFPVDQVLEFLADNALLKNSADLVICLLVVITVRMGR